MQSTQKNQEGSEVATRQNNKSGFAMNASNSANQNALGSHASLFGTERPGEVAI